ncbi:hypothetical protein BB561_001932 [Smittium simulii]|uniref:Rhodanese domain-containing protein n=1 Tax=Smittium simulii TaxID=133385 RepID=A0A2T9YSH1_9FUNG|nr:hypothetical protein BB561_001932 [Smittium simulii]
MLYFKKLLAKRSGSKKQIKRNNAAYSVDATKVVVGYDKLKELIHGIDKTQHVLIDVREPVEVERGFIPTSKFIPLAEIESAFKLNDKDFFSNYHFEKPSIKTAIIFYCRSGARSMKALETVDSLNLGLRLLNYSGSWNEYHYKTFQ